MFFLVNLLCMLADIYNILLGKGSFAMAVKPTYKDLEDRIEYLQQQLSIEEERFQDVCHNISEFLYEHDMEGNFTVINQHYVGMLDYKKEDLVNTNIRDLMPKRFRAQFDDYLERTKDNGEDEGLMQIIAGDRQIHIVEYKNILVEGIDGSSRVRGVAKDVTERFETERALIESEIRFRSILSSIEDGYFEVDLLGNFTFFNYRVHEHLEFTEDELMGMNYRQYMDKDNADKVLEIFHRVFVTGEPVKSLEWELMKKDGTRIFVEASVSLRKNSKDKVSGFQGIIRDITDRKRAEHELEYLAYHDALTGLYNRKAFIEKLGDTIKEAKRYAHKRAILYIDLDKFKKVNDIYGHEIGDKLLVEVSGRLQAILRESDYISRLGGDEFTIIMTNAENMNPEVVAGKVVERLSQPYDIMGIDIDFVSPSIGISEYPIDGRDLETLIKNADKAMYMAKDTGNAFICYRRMSPRIDNDPKSESGGV